MIVTQFLTAITILSQVVNAAPSGLRNLQLSNVNDDVEDDLECSEAVPEEPISAPTSAPVAPEDPTSAPITAELQGGCQRPKDCNPYETGIASCMIEEGCPELVPNAYYPDPENCAGYCFSTGTDAPCRYEVVDLAAPLVVDPYGTTYPSGTTWSDIPTSGNSAACSGNHGNPLDGTCGITQSQTNLWGAWGIPIPNLEHCKYWPDRDGGASGNLGTPPTPTNSF